MKYLPDFGWKPTVFIPENPSYPIIDDSLSKEVSPKLSIIKKKIWEPYQLAELFGKDNKKFKSGQFDIDKNQSWKSKLSIWVRGNFFIPDARVFWVKPSVEYLRKYLADHHFDAIVTTGPPHSVHLIGLKLKDEFPNIRWVADFRDPWTEISYYKYLKLSSWADRRHHQLEKQVFANADLTLATSYSDSENFRKAGANAFCITNGFDDTTENTTKKPTSKFTLSYVGVLEQLRNPEILWDTLNEILTENSDFANHFVLKFVGRIDEKIEASLLKSPLHKVVKDLGYQSHSDAKKEMESSDLLLITNFPEMQSKGIIPGKIFEYLATGNQILSFGPVQSDVQKILYESGAGQHFSYHDGEALKDYLLSQFHRWQKGIDTGMSTNISQFSRRYLTKKLVELLESFSK